MKRKTKFSNCFIFREILGVLKRNPLLWQYLKAIWIQVFKISSNKIIQFIVYTHIYIYGVFLFDNCLRQMSTTYNMRSMLIQIAPQKMYRGIKSRKRGCQSPSPLLEMMQFAVRQVTALFGNHKSVRWCVATFGKRLS